MGWHWHQLDHIHMICNSRQTDNHASTSPLSFYRPDALPQLPAAPTNSIKAVKAFSDDSTVGIIYLPKAVQLSVSIIRRKFYTVHSPGRAGVS